MNDRKHRRTEAARSHSHVRADHVVVQRRAQSEPRIAAQTAGGLANDPSWTWSFKDAVNTGVQLDGDPSGLDAATIHDHAARGVSGSATTLPYLKEIQQSFGSEHDVSGICAHVGGAATDAAESIGANAYATGNNVAFARAPSLHTAAHEAAHVIQQRSGVRLSDNIGRAGDVYERHADEVADRVVRGESAADLLREHTGLGGPGGSAVQRDLHPPAPASAPRPPVRAAPPPPRGFFDRIREGVEDTLAEHRRQIVSVAEGVREGLGDMAAGRSPIDTVMTGFEHASDAVTQRIDAAVRAVTPDDHDVHTGSGVLDTAVNTVRDQGRMVRDGVIGANHIFNRIRHAGVDVVHAVVNPIRTGAGIVEVASHTSLGADVRATAAGVGVLAHGGSLADSNRATDATHRQAERENSAHWDAMAAGVRQRIGRLNSDDLTPENIGNVFGDVAGFIGSFAFPPGGGAARTAGTIGRTAEVTNVAAEVTNAAGRTAEVTTVAGDAANAANRTTEVGAAVRNTSEATTATRSAEVAATPPTRSVGSPRRPTYEGGDWGGANELPRTPSGEPWAGHGAPPAPAPLQPLHDPWAQAAHAPPPAPAPLAPLRWQPHEPAPVRPALEPVAGMEPAPHAPEPAPRAPEPAPRAAEPAPRAAEPAPRPAPTLEQSSQMAQQLRSRIAAVRQRLSAIPQHGAMRGIRPNIARIEEQLGHLEPFTHEGPATADLMTTSQTAIEEAEEAAAQLESHAAQTQATEAAAAEARRVAEARRAAQAAREQPHAPEPLSPDPEVAHGQLENRAAQVESDLEALGTAPIRSATRQRFAEQLANAREYLRQAQSSVAGARNTSDAIHLENAAADVDSAARVVRELQNEMTAADSLGY